MRLHLTFVCSRQKILDECNQITWHRHNFTIFREKLNKFGVYKLIHSIECHSVCTFKAWSWLQIESMSDECIVTNFVRKGSWPASIWFAFIFTHWKCTPNDIWLKQTKIFNCLQIIALFLYNFTLVYKFWNKMSNTLETCKKYFGSCDIYKLLNLTKNATDEDGKYLW